MNALEARPLLAYGADGSVSDTFQASDGGDESLSAGDVLTTPTTGGSESANVVEHGTGNYSDTINGTSTLSALGILTDSASFTSDAGGTDNGTVNVGLTDSVGTPGTPGADAWSDSVSVGAFANDSYSLDDVGTMSYDANGYHEADTETLAGNASDSYNASDLEDYTPAPDPNSGYYTNPDGSSGYAPPATPPTDIITDTVTGSDGGTLKGTVTTTQNGDAVTSSTNVQAQGQDTATLDENDGCADYDETDSDSWTYQDIELGPPGAAPGVRTDAQTMNQKGQAPAGSANSRLIQGGNVSAIRGGGVNVGNGVVYLIDGSDRGLFDWSRDELRGHLASGGGWVADASDFNLVVPGNDWIELDDMSQATTALQAYVAKYGPIKTLYIVDHGSSEVQCMGDNAAGANPPGGVYLTDPTDPNDSDSNASRAFLQSLGPLMANGGVIVLGGCSVAGGPDGPASVQNMANLMPNIGGIIASRKEVYYRRGWLTGDFYLTQPQTPVKAPGP